MKNELEVIATTMSSRMIAEETGKRHDHVLVDCDNLNANYLKLNMPEISGMDEPHPTVQGRMIRVMHLTKIQVLDLLTGYRADLRIKVNRRWEELEKEKAFGGFKIPQTMSEALMLAAEQTKQLEIQAPKIEVYERIANADTLLSLNETAKSFGLGRNRLMKILRNNEVLTKENIPYQRFIERGYFEVKVSPIKVGPIIKNYAQTFTTGKGMAWLGKKLKNIT